MIEDLRSEHLLEAADANMVAFWMAYGRATGSEGDSTDDLSWISTDVPNPLFNSVVSMKRGAAGIKAVIDLMAVQIRKRGGPVLWWIGPQLPRSDLHAQFGKHGLQTAGETPAMAISLDGLDDDATRGGGFTVEIADTPERQAAWARTAAIGTGFEAAAVERLTRVEASMSDPGYRAQKRYVAFLDGRPVATSALVLDAGVAGIHAVATLPEARGRGIGRLMTLLPLLDARARGFRVGVLQASPMGRPIYAKMGFREVGAYRTYVQTA